jgi:hypothetical protein
VSGFGTILVDPPWPESGGGKIKRGADRHYPLIKTREEILETILRATRQLDYDQETFAFDPDPVGCLLWVWATRNYRGWAHWLIEALRFRYVTDFVWVKRGRPGLGQWARSQHEHLLLARRGKVATPPTDKRVESVQYAEREAHSKKPELFYDLIESISPMPRIELFARAPRNGWVAWGNEV